MFIAGMLIIKPIVLGGCELQFLAQTTVWFQLQA
jgi:hypothetical protein